MSQTDQPHASFRGVLESTGGTTAGFRVPDEIVKALGTSRKPAVNVTINDFTYRSSIAFMGGGFWLGVSNERRGLAKIAPGDEVDVDLVLDTAPRTVEVPPDFAAALAADPEAQAFFESLAYSHKSRHVIAINDAKTEETRQRRIAASVQKLHEGKK